jgi:hypothetical protein
MAKDRVATVRGIFLRPTVSKNNRYYSKGVIEGAVSKMQERLQSNEGMPLTMATSHASAATGSALTTVGRITGVSLLPDGSAAFEADIPDTSAGRDLAALVTSTTPYLKGVSIRGRWLSDPYETKVDGKVVQTGAALEVSGIDWTHSPGIEGAEIFSAEAAESYRSANPLGIWETVEATAFIDESLETSPDFVESDGRREQISDALESLVDLLVGEAGDAPGTGKKPYGNTVYADNGYQSDKKKRYPIDSAAHVRAAWSYINQGKNSGKYSSKQLANIKSKIKRAAKKFGIDIASESQILIDDIQSALEAYASTCITNGAGSIRVSGYTDDGGKLPGMAARIAYAAMTALNVLDPDSDGDIDLSTPTGSDSSSSEGATNGQPTDNNMESSTCPKCGAAVAQTITVCPTCGEPIVNAEAHAEGTESTEAIVADETNTQTAPALSEDDLNKITAGVVEALKALVPAPAAAPAEGGETTTTEETSTETPAGGETAPANESDTISRKKAKQMAKKAAEQAAELATAATTEAMIGELRKQGVAFREGTSLSGASESAGADDEVDYRAIAKMSNEEFKRFASPRVMSDPAVRRLNDRVMERAGGSTLYE